MIVFDRLNIKNWNGLNINLEFKSDLVVVRGDSSIGKSIICDIIYSEIKGRHDKKLNILYFNRKDMDKSIFAEIKQRNKYLVLIDDADIILNDEIRQYISFDRKNQYIIVSHSIKGFTFYTINNVSRLLVKGNRMFLQY